MARFLYVNESRGWCDEAVMIAKEIGFEIVTAASCREAQTALALGSFDAIISDYGRPRYQQELATGDGQPRAIRILGHVREQGLQTPFFLMSNRPLCQVTRALLSYGLNLPRDHILNKSETSLEDFFSSLEAQFHPQPPPRIAREFGKIPFFALD